MTPGRDGASSEDALSWDGDDDPTLEVGTSEPKALPDGYTALGKGSDEVGRIAPDGTVTMPEDRVPMGSATLVALGVLGGIYALYVLGWIVGGLRLQGTAQFLIASGAFQFGLWLAVAAPVLWFVTAYLLTRDSKPWLRIVWMVAGAVLLIPWPFIMTGAVGQ